MGSFFVSSNNCTTKQSSTLCSKFLIKKLVLVRCIFLDISMKEFINFCTKIKNKQCFYWKSNVKICLSWLHRWMHLHLYMPLKLYLMTWLCDRFRPVISPSNCEENCNHKCHDCGHIIRRQLDLIGHTIGCDWTYKYAWLDINLDMIGHAITNMTHGLYLA